MKKFQPFFVLPIVVGMVLLAAFAQLMITNSKHKQAQTAEVHMVVSPPSAAVVIPDEYLERTLEYARDMITGEGGYVEHVYIGADHRAVIMKDEMLLGEHCFPGGSLGAELVFPCFYIQRRSDGFAVLQVRGGKLKVAASGPSLIGNQECIPVVAFIPSSEPNVYK